MYNVITCVSYYYYRNWRLERQSSQIFISLSFSRWSYYRREHCAGNICSAGRDDSDDV